MDRHELTDEEILDVLEIETIRRANERTLTEEEHKRMLDARWKDPKKYYMLVAYIQENVQPRLEEEETFVIDDPENLVGFIVCKHMDEDDWYADDVFEKIVGEGIVVGKYVSRFVLNPNTEWWDMLEGKYERGR